MNNLSKREKKLLYFLLLFVIIVASTSLLIMPTMNRCDDLEELNIQKSDEKFEMSLTISRLKGYEEDISTLSKEITDLNDKLFANIPNSVLDMEITALLKQYSLSPDGVVISRASERKIAPYGTTIDVNNEAVFPEMYTNIVSITATGKTDDLIGFADYISKTDKMSISSLDLKSISEDNIHTYIINITVYMEKGSNDQEQ